MNRFSGWLVSSLALIIAGLLLGLATWKAGERLTPRVAEPEVVLAAVVAQALDDYAPVDAIRELSPDDHDATLEWALDRYAVVLRQMTDTVLVLDSLRMRLAKCEVRRVK